MYLKKIQCSLKKLYSCNRISDINENDADVDVQTVDWPGEPGVHITARADHTQVPASPTQPPQPLQLTLGSYLTLRIFTTELLS